ncbi:MAG: hypothetical protein JXL80_13380 [Planctomycetes bacterium]|nr:hypothetical protein [Planctomycetota bacterium]
MDIGSSILVSSLLLLAAVGLMVSHLRAWRRAQEEPLEPEEFDFRRRQFRRRIQTSAMLGLLAVGLFVGQLIPGPPMLVVLFWGVVLLVLGWMGLLALADIWATKHHFDRMRQSYLVEEAKLHAELRRVRAVGGNGKAKRSRPGPTGREEA